MTSSLCQQCIYWFFTHDFRPAGEVKPVTFCLWTITQAAAAVSAEFTVVCRVSKQKYSKQHPAAKSAVYLTDKVNR